MGWENRNTGCQRYYYRKARVAGRVVSAYVGAADVAGVIAARDQEDRTRAAALRAEQQAAIAAEQALDAHCAAFERAIRAATAGVLLLAGCHTHKGTWRRRRA